MKLEGRIAVVTGASQGLGFAIAHRFAQEGASVLMCARTADDLESAVGKGARRCHNRRDCHGRARRREFGDRRHPSSKFIEQKFGRLDILVSNAASSDRKVHLTKCHGPPGRRRSPSTFWEPRSVARSFYPCSARQRAAKILLLSGGGATKPRPFLSAYAASKAAVVRFGENLAEELREAGIDVNSIAPGALNTRLLEEVLAAGPEK